MSNDAIRALRRGRRPGARRVPRPPVHRPALRRRGRARPAGDARQDVADHATTARACSRGLPEPVHRHPLPLARGRARLRARRARDQRRVRGRPRDGPAPPRAPDRGRAVPPRVDPHRARPRPARATSSPRSRASSRVPAPERVELHRGSGAARSDARCGDASHSARPSSTSDASASASSSRAGTAPVAQPRHHVPASLAEAPRERCLTRAASRRRAGRGSRTGGASGHSAHRGSRGRHSSAPTSMSASSRSRPRNGRPISTHRRFGVRRSVSRRAAHPLDHTPHVHLDRRDVDVVDLRGDRAAV